MINETLFSSMTVSNLDIKSTEWKAFGRKKVDFKSKDERLKFPSWNKLLYFRLRDFISANFSKILRFKVFFFDVANCKLVWPFLDPKVLDILLCFSSFVEVARGKINLFYHWTWNNCSKFSLKNDLFHGLEFQFSILIVHHSLKSLFVVALDLVEYKIEWFFNWFVDVNQWKKSYIACRLVKHEEKIIF